MFWQLSEWRGRSADQTTSDVVQSLRSDAELSSRLFRLVSDTSLSDKMSKESTQLPTDTSLSDEMVRTCPLLLLTLLIFVILTTAGSASGVTLADRMPWSTATAASREGSPPPSVAAGWCDNLGSYEKTDHDRLPLWPSRRISGQDGAHC